MNGAKSMQTVKPMQTVWTPSRTRAHARAVLGIEPSRRPGVGSVRNAAERIGGPLQDVPHLRREGRPGSPVVVIGSRPQELHKLFDAHTGPSALAL
jgi:hypothetical protein